MKAGRFREDLFYRLHVLPLTIPPLRARREDIPHLVRHFLARFCAEENKRDHRRQRRSAWRGWRSFDWPGNVRQLENAVFRAVVMSEGDALGLADFPQIAGGAAVGCDRSIAASRCRWRRPTVIHRAVDGRRHRDVDRPGARRPA